MHPCREIEQACHPAYGVSYDCCRNLNLSLWKNLVQEVAGESLGSARHDQKGCDGHILSSIHPPRHQFLTAQIRQNYERKAELLSETDFVMRFARVATAH